MINVDWWAVYPVEPIDELAAVLDAVVLRC
jgi:hypothetical protein